MMCYAGMTVVDGITENAEAVGNSFVVVSIVLKVDRCFCAKKTK